MLCGEQMSDSETAEGREVPQKGIRPLRLRTILTAIGLSVLYMLSLWSAITEAERRSVSLENSPEGPDHLVLNVNVVRVDLSRSEMTTRISFHLVGQLAQDELTPATDLQVVLGTVHGRQQFDFEKGKRITPIEAVFPLQGEVNLYPFDHHTGVIWFFVALPEGQKGSPKPNIVVPEDPTQARRLPFLKKHKPEHAPEEATGQPGLPVGMASLKNRVQADTKIIFTASISGLTFRGSRFIQSAQHVKGLTGIEVQLSRSRNVVVISITAMLMMAAMTVGLVAMVLKIVNGTRRMATFHVPMAVSLIFGLPALRNIQPGIPPIGTFGDSVAFIWAEVAAAGSAIALVVHWLLHRMSSDTAPAQKS